MKSAIRLVSIVLMMLMMLGAASEAQKKTPAKTPPKPKKAAKTPSKTSQAAAVAKAKREIMALYNKMDAGIKAGDVNKAVAYFTEDNEDTDATIDFLKGFLEKVQVTLSTTKITGVKLDGDEATVSSIGRLGGLFNDPKTGELKQLEYRQVSQDVWIKTSKGWRLERGKVISQKQYVDGIEQGGGSDESDE